MKRLLTRFLATMIVVVSFGALLACGRTASPEEGSTQNFNPSPNPGNPTLTITTVFNLYGLGAFPNRIVSRGDNLFVVNSGSNSIQRINLTTGAVTNAFFTSPVAGANPWELLVRGSTGWVSNFVANTVDVLNMDTGALITSIAANGNGIFNDPEGLDMAANGLIFVANTDFDPAFNQGPGFVTVIDSATNQIVNQIPTSHKNPQYVVARGNTVYVVDSGEGIFDFGGCGCFRPLTDGAVDIIDANTARTATGVSNTIAIPLNPSQPLRGFPGSFAVTHDGHFAYLGSNSGVMYKIDLTSNTLLRDNVNPIDVTPDQTDNLVEVKTDPSGIVYILSFNQDGAYLLNTGNDTLNLPRISLDADPSNLEGPLDMAFRSNGNFADVYVLMSVSEQVSALITN